MMQMQTIECGAASLGIILGYYKKFVSLGELRYECSVARDGCNGLDIVQAAKHYGLEASAYRSDERELEQKKQPAILFWDDKHFVVLEGFSRKKVFINDPAFGHLAISREEFRQRYSKVAFMFQPGPEFTKSEKEKTVWEQVQVKKWPLYLFLALSGLLLVIPFIALPMIFRMYIDFAYHSNLVSLKLESLLFFFSALSLGILFSAFYFSVIHKIFRRISAASSAHFLKRVLRLPLAFYEQRDPREIGLRLEAGQRAIQLLIEEMIPAITQVCFSFIFAGILFAYDKITASAAVGSSLICLVAMYGFSRLSARATLEKELKILKTNNLDSLDSMESIKTVHAESHFFAKWQKLYTRYLNAEQLGGKSRALLDVAPLFNQLICTALLLGFGSLEIIRGHLSFGMLAASQILLLLFFTPFRRFIALTEKFAEIRKNFARMDDINHTELDRAFTAQKTAEAVENTLRLELKEISFSYYPNTAPYLENFSFEIEENKWIGLTGKIGSGKSTIAKLAAALVHPQRGRVCFRGRSMSEITSLELRKSVAWINHETFLFQGSIKENIKCGKKEISDERLFEIAKGLGLHTWILEKQNGYDEQLVERGRNLSQGQKQQIELARALLAKPEVLIWDEALNALDTAKQKSVLHFLRSLNISCLFITSRRFILQECDEVLVLEEGKIAQKGRDVDLIEAKGLYQDLFEKRAL